MNRYHVRPHHEPLNADKTVFRRIWAVVDRKEHNIVQFCSSRAEARRAAREGNELEEHNHDQQITV